MRPKHYASLEIDTFELWRKNKPPHARLNAADFNIHKYVMRNKGCDYEDYRKIISYCSYAMEALNEKEIELEEAAEYFEQQRMYDEDTRL